MNLKDRRKSEPQILSENSELRKELLSKSEIIKSLNEQIGKLSEADKVLKDNERLQNQNTELAASEQAARKEAEAEVTAVKKEYEAQKQQLSAQRAMLKMREWDIGERESLLETRKAALEQEISSKAQELVKQKIQQLEHAYNRAECALEAKFRQMRAGYHSAFFSALLYGFLVTLLQAVKNKVCRTEFAAFVLDTWEFVRKLAEIFVWLGKSASKGGDVIPQSIVAIIVHWMLQIVISGGLFLGTGFLLGKAICLLYRMICEKMANEITVAISLGTLAVLVFCAEYLTVLPINLVLIYFGVEAAYLLVRFIIQIDDIRTRKVIAMYVACFVTAVAAIVFGIRWIVG